MVASRWLAASQDGASHQPAAPSSSPRYHRPNGKRTEQLREDGSVGGVGVTVWFTIFNMPPPASSLYFTSAMSGSIPVVSQSIRKLIVPVGARTVTWALR